MSATESARLIVNPAARKGRAALLAPEVCEILRAQGYEVAMSLTRDAEEATQLAEQCEPETVLVALGGDGLHGKVAAGAITSGARVVPLPAGRGHDFARALNITDDVLTTARRISTMTERRIDVGLADGRPFLGVATFGYDSLANKFANEAPSVVPSPAVYAFGGARALIATTPQPIAVVVDGQRHDFVGWGLILGNSGRYGAGMRINPEAALDDGLLDVTVIGAVPAWQYPRLLPKLYRGTLLRDRDVTSLRGNEIAVLQAPTGGLYLDGDPADDARTFSVLPWALRVLT